MRYEIDQAVVLVPVHTLRESPKNKTIHADFDAHGKDAWFVENIREYGILFPLLVRPDRSVSDGHRRLAAAKLLKIADVPCIILRSTDADAAFSSAQLARQMSLFAKCVLYRGKINDLIRWGNNNRDRNLRQNGEPAGPGQSTVCDDNALHQEWIKVEEVLGVSRRNLTAGVKLLDRLESTLASGQPSDIDRANRVMSVFRNRGLKPALRMMDERETVADDEPDCQDWAGDDADEPERTARGHKRKIAAAKKFARKDEQPEPEEPWQTDVLKCLARVETLTKKANRFTPRIKTALSMIETDIQGAAVRRAA